MSGCSLTVVQVIRKIRIMSRIPKRARAVSATDAAKNFGGIVSHVREARAEYTVERGGVPVARIVPVLPRRSTVADLVEVLRSTTRSDEFGHAVADGVKAFNKRESPRDPWAS